MENCIFDLSFVHESWKKCICESLEKVNPTYLETLLESQWLPGPEKIFNAFSIPLDQVNYVLFGESPYPREISANGYAFWDNSVNELWSSTGLDKKVNRATSLRNILKMLLIGEGLLTQNNTSQEAISNINKHNLIQTNRELFESLLNHGFLLLNATPVLQNGSKRIDAKAWLPFMANLLECLVTIRPHVTFILFGKIAAAIDTLLPEVHVKKIYAEHPYNLSFVTNQKVIDFFRPFHLLRQK